MLVHGFPDTPHTWRHLGPHLAGLGYRVVAPWLPGNDAPVSKPVSAGTYVRSLLEFVASSAQKSGRFSSATTGARTPDTEWWPPIPRHSAAWSPLRFLRSLRLARDLQLPATQAVVLHMVHPAGWTRRSRAPRPGFWESLWADWSPGYDPREDVAELRRHVAADNIADIICPYRATSTQTSPILVRRPKPRQRLHQPPVPTLYLHGADDGAIGAELLGDVTEHLPAPGSAFEIVDGVGHFLHLEKPELIAAKISDWLRVSRPPRAVPHAAETVEAGGVAQFGEKLFGVPPPIM